MCVLLSETTYRALGRTRNLHYWQIIGFQPQGLCTCFATYMIICTYTIIYVYIYVGIFIYIHCIFV